MTPMELLKTVYLGDRACKAVSIQGWEGRVSVQVNVISRIRGGSGLWGFYTAEDIPDGLLVFAEVRRIRFDPCGPVPNDLINELVVSEIDESNVGKPVYTFRLSVGSVDEAGMFTEVVIEIEARDLYLQDPRTPAREIRE